MHPQPRRDPSMSGKERSPRHRPWSVYRANTFDLSSEMMGLALSGNHETVSVVTCLLCLGLKKKKRYSNGGLLPLLSTGNSQDPDEPVLEFSLGKTTQYDFFFKFKDQVTSDLFKIGTKSNDGGLTNDNNQIISLVVVVWNQMTYKAWNLGLTLDLHQRTMYCWSRTVRSYSRLTAAQLFVCIYVRAYNQG